jgi:hypothetical protein
MLKNIKSNAIAGIVVGLIGIFSFGGYVSANDSNSKSIHPIKTVYHVNDIANATDAMRNANNHLEADPTAVITFVTHSKGIDFLLEGAADKDGNPYNINVEKLMAKGVTFDVCNNTLVKRKIDPKTVLQGAQIVPSGVAEVAKLQAVDGYVYIKP